ncbi:translation initiation factor IF-3 [Oscillatoria salina]|uniref:translation initiation factor IF-3 n=1 Tax=Oscillatoria salina TaxID=331517 RepID=UPI0013BE604B|nr:translation initiation factor IF-3 [Oscillatoria salina]MBZ8179347.1 translation initiation factor IF-3 [Oscillatoria salina IIICB1]NET91208.1 translation initiation factor IF-3 [Kamptonema sp. SIO1D9]
MTGEIVIAFKSKQQINRHIKADQVLLIDKENNNRGLTDTSEALREAKQAGLDLVVVSQRKNDAPVAKILDYGKHKYQQQKRQRQNQSAKPTLKEVKLRPNVGDSDYGIRIDRAVQWLDKGNLVKFQVRLRGRERQHRDRAIELLERVISDLGEAAKVQTFDRRSLIVQVVPAS